MQFPLINKIIQLSCNNVALTLALDNVHFSTKQYGYFS